MHKSSHYLSIYMCDVNNAMLIPLPVYHSLYTLHLNHPLTPLTE